MVVLITNFYFLYIEQPVPESCESHVETGNTQYSSLTNIIISSQSSYHLEE